jgi:predicted metalloprotease with PDZ domain
MPSAARASAPLTAAVAAVLLSLACAAPVAAAEPSTTAPTVKHVSYTVTVADTAQKRFHVEVRAEGVTAPSVSFAIPAWSPGWYVLSDAHKNVSAVSASVEGAGRAPRAADAAPADNYTWKVATGGAPAVTLSYDVAATDRNYGFLAPYLDGANGYVPGPATLMYVVGGKTAPCTVTYSVPDGWKVASANDPTDRPDTFTAPDYDTLADQPADLGAFRRFDKKIGGVPFSVVLVGAGDSDVDGFAQNVWKISAAGVKVFGGAPFPRYVYHFRTRRGGGYMAGLEHRNSTVITAPLSALRSSSSSALSITAHEFAHAWNVKRIRPDVLGPFDYTAQVRTKDLWWMEGVTDYYAPRLLLEAGLRGRDYWYGYMAEQINQLQNNPARSEVTLEEASVKVWEGDESEGYHGLSYYNKGLVVGMLLDLEMRRRTQNRVGLDDLTRALLEGVKKRGDRGYPEGEIERLASSLTGTDMKPFFDRALRSTEELSYKDPLAAAGLRLDERGTTSAFLGVQWDFAAIRAGAAPVSGVVPDGPAAQAGIKAGDVITAVDGTAAENLFGPFFANKQPGQAVVLTVRGRSEGSASRDVPVTLGKRETFTYRVRPVENPTPAQEAVLAAVTGVPAGGAAATTPAEGDD